MGETIIEKIIRHNTGKAVKPGDIVTVNVDRVMIHDIFIPFVAEKFEEMGFTKLHDPDKVVLIYDHLVPASQLDDTRHFHVGDAFAEKYGMNKEVVYPHSFRHRFAKNFLDRFNDLALLADLMGHESIETTRIYLRRTASEQQKIVDKVVNW